MNSERNPQSPPDMSPIFVLGMNGSGTTMLLDCLGRHPELYGFPRETRTIPQVLRGAGLESLSDDDFHKLLADVCRIPAFMQMNGDEAVPVPEDWMQLDRSPGCAVSAVMRHFAGPARWIEKTPQHALHIPLLYSAWPNARFIHVIRDGRRCAASFHRRWRRTPSLTAWRWKNLIRRARVDSLSLPPGRYIEIRYEDLCDSPEHWMHKICELVGVSFDPAVLVSEHPQTSREGELGSISKQDSPIDLDEGQLSLIESIIGKELAGLGYAVRDPNGDRDPHKISRILWMQKDYCMQFANEIRSKIRGENRKSWETIRRLPRTAIAQFLNNIGN